MDPGVLPEPLSQHNRAVSHFLNRDSLNVSRPLQRFTLGGCLSNHPEPTDLLTVNYVLKSTVCSPTNVVKKRDRFIIHPVKAYFQTVEELNCVLNAPKTRLVLSSIPPKVGKATFNLSSR